MTRKLTIAATGLHQSLQVPGDKSITHRAIMLGSLATGQTTVEHMALGQDCLTTMKAFQALGVPIKRDGDTLTISGQSLASFKQPQNALQMNNSGTTTRLLMGILAGSRLKVTLVGDDSLMKRPMARVSQPLEQLGANIQTTEGKLPATIVGKKLQGAKVELQVASAQVKSALLLAGLQANEPTIVVEKLPTRNHTEIMLRQFGAQITTADDQRTITLQPNAKLSGQTVYVPGDMSSAAFFLVAGVLVDNSNITLTKVSLNPTRTGILTVLQKMGAKLDINRYPTTGEPYGDISIQSSSLNAIQLTAADIPNVIDELPLIALLAALASGTSKITGAKELRYKETDRIKTVTQELRKLGVNITELPDGWEIVGAPNLSVKDSRLDSHGDHRLGMMLAVAALTVDTPLTLNNDAAVAVSYPEFFADLNTLLGDD